MEFVVRLGLALHSHGAHAARVESAMTALARRFELIGNFFALPTSIHVGFGPLGQQTVFLVRTEPGSQDLGRLAALDALLVRTVGGLPLAAARTELGQILQDRRALPVLVELGAHACAAAAAGVFLSAGPRDVLAATALGFCSGGIARGLGARADTRVLADAVAAFVVALSAALLAAISPSIHVGKLTLAGVIYLLPGFTLTTAVTEIATRHLASGTARFAGASASFLTLAFGAALGWHVGFALVGRPEPAPIEALPVWSIAAALLLAPTAYATLLRVARRDIGIVFASCLVAFAGSRLGAAAFGAELGAFGAALVVGTFANAVARRLDRPASIPLVPGLFLLVPGSIGFASLEALFQKDAQQGLITASTMMLVATALVAGVLMANVLLPSRRVL
ncbi:MAG: threonine/serine exporter family protein [Planctomycetota bacterium]